jgi:1-acyl-sn-glycerol-3-phosphate acyltransferase
LPAVRQRSMRHTTPVYFLWGLAADAAVTAATLWWGTLATILTLTTRSSWPVDVFGPIWARWILKACGIDVQIEGLRHIDRSKSYVVISNHLSNFDVFATLGALPLKVRFVAKKELTKVPVFGWALALSDHIIIDRAKPEEAIARINAHVAKHLNEGFCLLFYAEGTRSPDGKIHQFKKGGVTLAIRTGLPIVPMSVSGTRKFLPKGRVVIQPGGRVKIVLDKPIDTTGYSLDGRNALNARVRNAVLQNFIENYT